MTINVRIYIINYENPSAFWVLSCFAYYCCHKRMKVKVLTGTWWTRFWNYRVENPIKIKEADNTGNIN